MSITSARPKARWVFAPFPFAALLVGLTDLLAMRRVAQVRAEANDVVQDELTDIELLSRMQRDVDRAKLLSDRHILEKDSAVMGDLEAQLGKSRADFAAAAADYEAMPMLPDEKRPWDDLKATLAELRPRNDAMLALSRANEDVAARRAFEKLEAAREHIDADLRELIDVNHRAAQEGVARVTKLQETLATGMQVLTLAGVAVSLGLGVVVARALRAREERLRASAEQLEANNRELAAYAGIGEVMAAAEGFDELLSRLLQVFIQSCPDVDTATILLREDDPDRPSGRLRVKASIGLEDEALCGYTIPIGEGFGGTIAASRQPLLLDDAARSPLVLSEWVRHRGIRAFYGVPLISNGELVGVAHIGSRIASDFPAEEKRLFAAMAGRAADAIAQAFLRDQVNRRHAQLDAVVNALPDGLLFSDQNTVLVVNSAAEELLGGAGDVVGRSIEEIARRSITRDPDTGEEVPLAQLPLWRALRGERAVGEYVGRNPRDERDFHLRAAAAPVIVRGEVIGAVAIWSDITKVVELEHQRDRFMHAVVHDLRNPLQSMISSTQLVMRKMATPHPDTWAVERLQKVVTNAFRLDRLLGDLLDLSLAKSGKLEIRKAPVPLSDVIEEQAGVWSSASRKHRLDVHCCHASVLADRDRVVQVLDNLLSNAIKYSPDGGCIDVSCAIDHGEARIMVRDDGLGISREDQARLFSPYSRSGRPASISGHGLGLFISSEIVRQHGGRMGVRSEPGKGAEFWFTLPLAENPRQSSLVH
jgi:signal transduction histidine kinase/GAF domain-containing protein